MPSVSDAQTQCQSPYQHYGPADVRNGAETRGVDGPPPAVRVSSLVARFTLADMLPPEAGPHRRANERPPICSLP